MDKRKTKRTTRRDKKIIQSESESRSRSTSVKRKLRSPDFEPATEKKQKQHTHINTGYTSDNSQEDTHSEQSFNYIIDNNMTDQDENVGSPGGHVHSPMHSHLPGMVTVSSQMIPPGGLPQHFIPGMMQPQSHTGISDHDIMRIKMALRDEISQMVHIHVEQATAPLRQEIINLKEEVQMLKTQCESQTQKQDETEQYSRKNNVRISNYKAIKDDDFAQAAVDIAKEGDVELDKSDIENAHKLGQKQDDIVKDFIVRFKSFPAKLKFLKSRKVLKNKDAKIYINDDLTQLRSEIAYMARQIKNDKNSKIKGTWVFNGCVYIETKGGETVRIKGKEHLSKYKGEKDDNHM